MTTTDIGAKPHRVRGTSTLPPRQGQATMIYAGATGTATLAPSESYPQLDGIYASNRPSWDTRL